MKRNQKGFTLVEVMIVVAIIAILAAIAVPNLLRARISSNDAVAQSTLRVISTALENYYATHNNYPTNVNDLLGVDPPYLQEDYFAGDHNGFTYTHNVQIATYSVTAYPISQNLGSTSYTITTGALLSTN